MKRLRTHVVGAHINAGPLPSQSFCPAKAMNLLQIPVVDIWPQWSIFIQESRAPNPLTHGVRCKEVGTIARGSRYGTSFHCFLFLSARRGSAGSHPRAGRRFA